MTARRLADGTTGILVGRGNPEGMAKIAVSEQPCVWQFILTSLKILR